MNPNDKDTRAQAARLLRLSPEEVDAYELSIIEELIEHSRLVIKLHKLESDMRLKAMAAGTMIEDRWQVSPGVADRVARLMIRLLITRRQRLGLEPPPEPMPKAA